jgi:hypothetical protein
VEWWRSVFEAIVGPLVVATLISTMGLGFAAWGRLVELEFELARHRDAYSVLLDRFERNQRDYRDFRDRGNRYTKEDAAKDTAAFGAALGTLQERLESLATRCDGCRFRIDRLEVQMQYLDKHK